VGAVWVFLDYVVVKNVQMRKCADVQMKIWTISKFEQFVQFNKFSRCASTR
jgi:hypothetical protein